MGTNWKRLQTFGKYLVPKNNLWLKRTGLLLGFVLLDYIVTLLFITTPLDEGNLLVRFFMENFGIFWGLTIFDILINIPIYLLICFNSHFITLPSKFAKIADPAIDAFLAWFVAGHHFNGATSWFWTAPDLIRQLTGFSIYVLFAVFAYQASNIQQLFISRQKQILQEHRT